jgi:hypothetical protein
MSKSFFAKEFGALEGCFDFLRALVSFGMMNVSYYLLCFIINTI